jgi:putative ABC transport system ATP-binding protein
MAASALLRAEHLSLAFSGGDRPFTAVDGVDLNLDDRRYMAIVGPSGSGKSSLLYLLSGLRRPTSGSVHFRGVDYAALGDAGVAALRRQSFGFIFQQHFLVNYLGALENVLVGARSPRTARTRALELLDRLGLGSKAGQRPYQLSVGERQRVAVARAMISEPAVIFAVEPTASLDQRTGREVIQLLGEYREHGSVLVVTHDVGMTSGCDVLLEMRDGRLGPPPAEPAPASSRRRRSAAPGARTPGPGRRRSPAAPDRA